MFKHLHKHNVTNKAYNLQRDMNVKPDTRASRVMNIARHPRYLSVQEPLGNPLNFP